MTVSDILDGAFKLMKANVRAIITIAAVFVVPLQLLSTFLQREQLRQSFDLLFGGPVALEPEAGVTGGELAAIGLGFLNVLILPFMAGAISLVVAASYLGDDLGPAAALRRTLKRFWALVGAWIVVHLLQVGGFVVLGVLAVLLAVAGAGGFAVGFAVFLAVVVGLPVLLAVMGYSVLVAPAIVVEELGGVSGVRRSWGLVRGRFWPVLGISLLAGILVTVIASALSFLPTALVAVVPEPLDWVVAAAGSILSSVITQPIVAIVATLLYFDARIRKEGFDLQVIASELTRDRGIVS